MSRQLDLSFAQTATVNRERMRVFHNTTDLQGEELAKREFRAGSQTAEILTYFQLFPDHSFTPWELQERMNIRHAPITSIRRAISDLTKQGYLEKTSEKRPGQYNDLCYAWKLRG